MNATKMTRRKICLYLVLVWLWSAICASPPLFGWGNYIPEGKLLSLTATVWLGKVCAGR